MEAAGKRYIVHPSRSDWLTLWNLSDIHYGSKACALDTLKADIETIRRDPHAFWVGGGDYAEYISHRDRRFDAETITETLQIADLGRLGRVLTERIRDVFLPIRHKCLGLVYGNHEAVYQRENEQRELHGWLCTELGVANLGYSALMDVVFVRHPKSKAPALVPVRPVVGTAGGFSGETFRLFITHGAGASCTPGGKLNRLIQYMNQFEADIFMVGHVHDQKGQRMVKIGASGECTRIEASERIGVISGSYLKTYAQGVTTYGEMKGYAPVPLGASFIRIRPETREMKGEI